MPLGSRPAMGSSVRAKLSTALRLPRRVGWPEDTSDDKIFPGAAAAQRRRAVIDLLCGAIRDRLGWSSGFPREEW